MLWNIIRDWFVQYIFGGVTSNGNYFACSIGHVYDNINGIADADQIASTDVLQVPIGDCLIDDEYTGYASHIAFGDWASTLSTIIVLILICVFLFLCVRYLFKVGAGLFSNLRG